MPAFDALLSGAYWNGIEVTGRPTVVTFSFSQTPPAYDGTELGAASWVPFTEAAKTAARAALAEWSAASGIVFLEVTQSVGDVNFGSFNFAASGTADAAVAGYAYYPFGGWDGTSFPYFTTDVDRSGDVYMDTADLDASGVPNYGTLLHEIGHAIGLKHPSVAGPAVIGSGFYATPPHNETIPDDPNVTIMSQQPPLANPHLLTLDQQAAAYIYGAAGTAWSQVSYHNWNAATETLDQRGFENVNDVMRGISANDFMMGRGGDDLIFSLNGNDTVYGGTGNDSIWGGSGNDYLSGDDGSDTIYGGDGNDRIYGGTGSNQFLYGDAGDDIIYDYAGTGGGDASYGGDGNDLIFISGSGIAFIYAFGGMGNDTINAVSRINGTTILYGDEGNDTLRGSATDSTQFDGGSGNDQMTGGSSSDLFYANTGSDTMYGGGGVDLVDYTSAVGGVYVNLAVGYTYKTTNTSASGQTLPSNLGTYTTDHMTSIESVNGSAYGDRIYGTAGRNSLFGNDGDDVIYGLGSDISNYYDGDFIFGGNGNDTIISGAGQGQYISGDAGNDIIYIDGPNNSAYGGEGNDRIILSGVDGNGTAAGDAGDDTIDAHGRSGVCTLFGGDGNDTIIGGTGSILSFNLIFGGDGNDRMYGGSISNRFGTGAGNDIVYGGAGRDRLDYSLAEGAVYVDMIGSTGYAYETANTSLDGVTLPANLGTYTTDTFTSIEDLDGSVYGDRLYGTNGDNQISGDAGNDVIYGRDGTDTIIGGDGDDLIIGGNGTDYLSGGAGADRFFFIGTETGFDSLQDFDSTTGDLVYLASGGFGTYTTGAAVSIVNGTGTSDQIFGAQNTQGFAYDTDLGFLYFDRDGSGGTFAAVLVADFNPTVQLTLTSSAFVVY